LLGRESVLEKVAAHSEKEEEEKAKKSDASIDQGGIDRSGGSV